jgi:hypothetical protein
MIQNISILSNKLLNERNGCANLTALRRELVWCVSVKDSRYSRLQLTFSINDEDLFFILFTSYAY